MGNKTLYQKPERLDKLTKTEHQELTFDLINAFALVRTPTDSTLLLRDLLTKKEIQNLAKRLRIAKLLLSERKQDEITDELHCSFATISKVKMWLDEGGKGLKGVIQKLPKMISKPQFALSYPQPNLPKILAAAIKEAGYFSQKRRVKRFLDDLEEKHLIDKKIRERLSEEFRTIYHKKKKTYFINATSLHRKVETTSLHSDVEKGKAG